MYRIKQDQRTIRSSQLIYQALATLMREKPFIKISVTNVVETAQVGRTTFYRIFDEIEDVLRMRCDQVFDELIAYLIAYRQEGGSLESGTLLKPMLRYFYLHSDIIELLLRAKRMDILQDAFRERARGIQQQISQQMPFAEEYLAYGAEIRINVMIAIVAHWVKTGKRQAPDELADTLKVMLNNMIAIDRLL